MNGHFNLTWIGLPRPVFLTAKKLNPESVCDVNGGLDKRLFKPHQREELICQLELRLAKALSMKANIVSSRRLSLAPFVEVELSIKVRIL